MSKKPKINQWEKTGFRTGVSLRLNHLQNKSSPSNLLLGRSEDWRQIVDAIPDLIFVTDREHHIVWANRAACNKLNLPMQAIVGKNCSHLVHGLNAPSSEAPCEKLITDSQPHQPAEIEVENLGGTFLISTTSFFDDENQPGGTICIARDMTDVRQVEKGLRESEERYRTLVKNIPDVIFSTDKDGKIFDIHLPADTFCGYVASEMLDCHYTAFIFDPDKRSVFKRVGNALRGRVKFAKGIQSRIVSKEGHPNWVEANLRMRFDARGVCTRTDVIVRDINDLKNAEAELQQSHRELKSAYDHHKILSTRLIKLLEKDRQQVAMELHDRMGQSLGTLRTGFRAIRKRLDQNDTDLLELVRSVEKQTVEELISLKNISYELRPNMLDHLGLVPSIRTLIADFEDRTSLQIRFFTKDIPREVNPDKALALYRIVQESFTNIVRHAKATKVYISLIRKDGKILLSIEDNGIGFDHQEKTVYPDDRGLLGIHIMKERASQVDGDFMIESQTNKGTQVIVEVPFYERQRPSYGIK